VSADLKALEARLHEPMPVHERVRVLNEMAEQLYERDAARGVEVAREAIDLARATADAAGEAQGSIASDATSTRTPNIRP
jgi:hypothetical protein